MDTLSNKNNEWLDKPSQPYWIASTDKTDYPLLKEDINVDAAIVGGGLVGITLAYLLKKEGLKIAVIEADRIAQGTSGHTTAKITSQHDLIYQTIKNKSGEEKAKQYADANESSINFISDIIKENNIDCDFLRKSAYIYTNSDQYISQIQEEAKVASSLGIKASIVDKIPYLFDIKAALKYDDQAQFHPRKYILALAQKIQGVECSIYENTRAKEVEQGDSCIVTTNNGKKITAKNLIVASHYPFFDGMGMYFARMYVDRSYVIGAKIKEKFPDGMFKAAEETGLSLRSQPFEDGELILFGGESHKTGHGENFINNYKTLEEKASAVYTIEKVLYRWSTQDYMSIDNIPYVGHLTSKTPNIFVATGFRKWGMTNSTAAARIIKDLILKGESPWAAVYNPSRHITADAIGNLATANADVAKHLIKGKLASLPTDVDIKPGEGKKISVDDQKIGAYRDSNGQLHLVDTTCTHVGCELVWNSAENSWDCPCHGSRFTYEGDIMDGPAINPLNHQGEVKNPIDPNLF